MSSLPIIAGRPNKKMIEDEFQQLEHWLDNGQENAGAV